MLRKKSFYICALVLGICLMGLGALLSYQIGDEIKPIIGTLFGIGASLAGTSTSFLIGKRIENKHPERRKQNEIDYNDERNAFIRYKSKAKAADIIKWFVMGIAYITIIIGAPLYLTLATVSVFLLYGVLILFYTSKFQKEI